MASLEMKNFELTPGAGGQGGHDQNGCGGGGGGVVVNGQSPSNDCDTEGCGEGYGGGAGGDARRNAYGNRGCVLIEL